MHKNISFLGVILLALSACSFQSSTTISNPPSSASGATEQISSENDSVAECTKKECGPSMGMPNWQCSDGTIGGPNCERRDDGTCGWIIRQCPSSSSSSIESDCLCQSGLVWDESSNKCVAKGMGVCPQYMEVGGFCGCDGKKYTNSCYAAQAGVKRGGSCASSATNDVVVTSPAANALVQSPLTVSGKARGGWYFEASFPVRLLDDQGNTSAASIPLALDIAVRDGRVKRGDLLLLESFGGGLVWGSALVRY